MGFSCRGNGSGPISKLLKTTDGGLSWTTTEIESGIGNTVIEDLSFISESTGFKCGWYESHLTRTMDSGINWEYPAFTDSTLYVQLRDLHIEHDQPNAYYACGWYGTIIKSVDGGNTWYEMVHGYPMENEIFYGIYFLNENIGWIVGSDGIILKTTNGGGPVGLTEFEKSPCLRFFPNPTNGRLHIDNPDGIQIKSIQLLNRMGQIIFESNEKDFVELGDIPAGLYLAIVKTSNGDFTEKIIIK